MKPELFYEILVEINEINQIETKELPVKIIKFNEEFGEFSAEVLKMLGYTYKEYDENELKSEMADSLQCLLSIFLDICEKRNINFEDILNKVKEKNEKWRNKISSYKKNL